MGGVGGPAGAAVMGEGAAEVMAGALGGSIATEVTGSGRSGLGSLMSLIPSTLELSGLISRMPLPIASVLDGSEDLAES